MSKILIIEDDQIISDGVRQALEFEGHQVVCAYDGENGLFISNTQHFDLVILDIMMPEMNGFEVITEMRRTGDNIPIIVLSARTATVDKVRGLDLGADDYLSKPFDLDELLARIRRFLGKEGSKIEVFGKYQYHWKERNLIYLDQSISLQAKERLLLEYFLKRKNQIVSREQILDKVWGHDYDGTDRTVDNLIVNLRKKVGGEYLFTERGLGYRFVTKV